MQKRLPLLSIHSLAVIMAALLFSITTNAFDRMNTISDSTTLQGRWNITVDVDGQQKPSWLEIRKSGSKMLVGRFVGLEGSARPISRIHFENGKMHFSIPPQWEREPNDLYVEGKLDGDGLSGTIKLPSGKTWKWEGKRAPELRSGTVKWGEPIRLFDGKKMDAWHATGKNQWIVESGLLRNPVAGSNLVTHQKFDDFKLHLEFRYPQGSNGGVYLRGRYEVQIIDSKGQRPDDLLFGGIYGFLTPSVMAAKAPGEWQTFDITLVGRMITIVANGITIIKDQEIPGTTGGALDSNEGEPGPILLQGDHGAIDFRNIIITPGEVASSK